MSNTNGHPNATKICRKIERIQQSAQNHLNRGGGVNSQRWDDLQEQWSRIEDMDGFAEAAEQMGHHPQVNLGDLACQLID
jgi:hypothetical protein